MSARRRDEARGLAALLAGAVCIGIAPLFVRWSEVGPVATAFHRIVLALPFLMFWGLRQRPAQGPLRPPVSLAWVIGAGVCFALDLAAWHLSVENTSIANATLLANLAPVFVTLGAWLVLSERVERTFLAGMTVGLAGAWLLTGASFRTNPENLRGDLLGIATAFFYGAYQLCVARLCRSLPAGRVLLWSSLVSAPLLGLISAGFGEVLLPATPAGWMILVGLALTAQVAGQGLITYGFGHLPASHSSLTLLVQPLVAVVAAWLAFGEALSAGQAAGGLLLIGGIWVARLPAPLKNVGR